MQFIVIGTKQKCLVAHLESFCMTSKFVESHTFLVIGIARGLGLQTNSVVAYLEGILIVSKSIECSGFLPTSSSTDDGIAETQKDCLFADLKGFLILS